MFCFMLLFSGSCSVFCFGSPFMCVSCLLLLFFCFFLSSATFSFFCVVGFLVFLVVWCFFVFCCFYYPVDFLIVWDFLLTDTFIAILFFGGLWLSELQFFFWGGVSVLADQCYLKAQIGRGEKAPTPALSALPRKCPRFAKDPSRPY